DVHFVLSLDLEVRNEAAVLKRCPFLSPAPEVKTMPLPAASFARPPLVSQTDRIWQFGAVILQRQTKNTTFMQTEINFYQAGIEECFNNFISLIVWAKILM
ncbi:MAG: hypothetical protein II144_05190, partial [Paludibacteraceae bacterium]|nr:hypothetical protein [Paludibacteraceae bacterium]